MRIINMLVKLNYKNMTEKCRFPEQNVSEVPQSFVTKFCLKLAVVP